MNTSCHPSFFAAEPMEGNSTLVEELMKQNELLLGAISGTVIAPSLESSSTRQASPCAGQLPATGLIVGAFLAKSPGGHSCSIPKGIASNTFMSFWIRLNENTKYLR